MSALPSSPSPRRSGAELLHAIAAGTAAVTGTAFLRSLVRHVAEALDADAAFAAEVEDGGWERATVLASWAPDGGGLEEGLEIGVRDTPCELTLAIHGTDGRRLGYLGVMSRRALEAGEDELAVLGIFASRAGAEIERRRDEAAHHRREADLAASRARLVAVADEERRRIGRNLHDGAQQRLVVLGHRIEIARRKLEQSAADDAVEHLRHAADEARAAGAELRELSRGLHPAGLAEYGLEPTLAALAARSALPLEVAGLPDRRLPEVIEATLYYLVSEALANAVKHADATRLRVEVSQRADRVVAAIHDDGRGGAAADGGSGLQGLVGRLDALGGRLEVDSPAGAGTTLRATIPLGPWRTAREPFLEFGHANDDGLGERLIAQVLSGEKTASISLAREWELEGGTPRIGQQLPVMDHHGRRHGTVEVVRIAVMPFGEVDAGAVEEHDPHGVGADEWRGRQREYYDRCREQMATLLDEPSWRLTDAEPVVVLRFRLVSGPG